MGDVARRARLSKQTMTTMVRLAERDGLVERRPDPRDGRATRVHLSEKGRRFQPVAEAVLKELDAAARASLGERATVSTAKALRALAELGDPPG
jgi:DNA-binding MarR family transcriptional regulator